MNGYSSQIACRHNSVRVVLLTFFNQTTTEIYNKQRWRETAAPNMVVMG